MTSKGLNWERDYGTVMSQENPASEGSCQQPQKVRPVITPDAFNGELSWDEWIGHFESVARINEWDDATRLLWLEVRMTGKAQSAWRRITDEAKACYDTAKAALRKRFNPTAGGSFMQWSSRHESVIEEKPGRS